MNKLIGVVAFLLGFCAATYSQKKPNDFPEKTTAVGLDEIYSQYNDTAVRIKFSTARKYFAPDAQMIASSTIPSTTGNTERNVILTDPNGDIWFIDWNGDAIRLDQPSGLVEYDFQASFTGTSVTIPGLSLLPNYHVYRTGVLLRKTNDYTQSGNTLSFTVPFVGEHLRVMR